MNNEKTIIIDVNLTRGLAVVLVVGLLALTLMGYLAFGHKDAAASSPQVSTVSSTGMRQYYLSTNQGYGADADNHCEAGYHFASLWEIMDPSNLQYNNSLGQTRTDSGEGPPSNLGGWIRTGYLSSTFNTPGYGNCLNWNSVENTYYGTYANLPHDWSTGGDMGIWKLAAGSCGTTNLPSWCVEN
jgi:hypothetical protein